MLILRSKIFGRFTEKARSKLADIGKKIKERAQGAVDKVKDRVGGAVGKVKDRVGGAVGKVKDKVGKKVDNIKDTVNEAYDTAKTTVGKMKDQKDAAASAAASTSSQSPKPKGPEKPIDKLKDAFKGAEQATTGLERNQFIKDLQKMKKQMNKKDLKAIMEEVRDPLEKAFQPDNKDGFFKKKINQAKGLWELRKKSKEFEAKMPEGVKKMSEKLAQTKGVQDAMKTGNFNKI